MLSSGSDPESDFEDTKNSTVFFEAAQAQHESMNDRVWESESDREDEDGHETDSSQSQGPARIVPLKKISSNRPDPEDVLPTKRKKRNNHKIRVPGGHAPTFKPISVDYDSEDALLVDMKQKGYKDEEIADRFIEEGYTQYDPKSIASRWVRIRKKIQAYEEKLLDEELTDWHIGEDQLLRDAVMEADEKVREEIQKIHNKRFDWVAQSLNKRSSRPRFSARACRDRLEDLDNGTARCPPELDSDPEGRRRERDQRLADFKRLRREAEEKFAVEAAEKKKWKRANSAKKQAAAQRRETEQRIREQKKKEEEEYRQSRTEASEMARVQRKIAVDAACEWRKYEEEKHRVFTTLHKRLRKEADAMKKLEKKYGGMFPFEEGAFEGTGPPGKSKFAVKNTQEELMDIDFSATEAAINARAALFQGQAPGVRVKDIAPLGPPPKRPRLSTDPNKNYGFFGEDPREFCTVPELHDILRSRKMLLNRMKETKGVMCSRLRAEDESLSHAELQDLLNSRGAPTNGSTEVLIRRLAEEDAKTSNRYITKYLPQPIDKYGRKIKKPAVEKAPKHKFDQRYSAYESSSKRSQVRRNAAKDGKQKSKDYVDDEDDDADDETYANYEDDGPEMAEHTPSNADHNHATNSVVSDDFANENME